MEVTQTRRANLLRLFSEFVSARHQATSVGSAPAGLDKAFAQQLEIHNTYFSGMKSGARPIGDKLARQIEAHTGMHKGWLDIEHVVAADKSRDLQKFLELAEQVYTQADKVGRARLKALLKNGAIS